MTDDRYQNQTRVVKFCRWLRWKPFYCVLGCWAIVRWAARGCPKFAEEPDWPMTRWEHMGMIWRLSTSEADMKMRHYYTLEEVLSEYRERAGE